MRTISAETFGRKWDELGYLSNHDAAEIIDAMRLEQPALLDYLFAVGEEFTQSEREFFISLGIVTWQIMREEAARKFEQLDDTTILSREKDNFDIFHRIEEKPEMVFLSVITELITEYHQHEVLLCILDILINSSEEGCGVRRSLIGMMFVYLKTIIDCVDHMRMSRS